MIESKTTREVTIEKAIRNVISQGYHWMFDEEAVSIVFMAKVREEWKKIMGIPYTPMRRIW